MEIRTETLSPEQAMVQAVLGAGLLLGLAVIAYLLTRASTRSRIQASEPGRVLRWWLIPAALWLAILVLGGLLLPALGRLGSLAGAIVFGALILALILVPFATLLATLLWVWPRLRGTQ